MKGVRKLEDLESSWHSEFAVAYCVIFLAMALGFLAGYLIWGL